LSLDCARLAQCSPGSAVHFTAIDAQTAHQILHLANYRELSMTPEVLH
jgi:allophanate hydrolase subunit 2